MKRLLLLLLIAGFGLIGCSTTEADEGSHEASHGDEQGVTVTALDEFRFEPATIEVVANRPVALTLINEGVLDHDFSIVEVPLAGAVEVLAEEEAHDEEEEAHHEEEGTHHEEEETHQEHEMIIDEDELMVHISAKPDDQETAVFTPTEPGEYAIICTVPGHREAGMVGTLIVTAP